MPEDRGAGRRSTRPGPDAGAGRMRERHVRFATSFILTDPRVLGRSDAALALYLHIEALAVELKHEFLPAEYDVREISRARRRSPKRTQKALDELAEGHRPLVGVLPDGRLRIIGVRSKHGEKIKWHPESDDWETWEAAHGRDKWFAPDWNGAAPKGGRCDESGSHTR